MPDAMRFLASADNLLIATLWQRMLEAAGIRCELRNRYIGAAVGDLPADQVAPQLWLRDSRDHAAASALLSEWRAPSALPSWRCASCREQLEGQFFQCWNCGATQTSG